MPAQIATAKPLILAHPSSHPTKANTCGVLVTFNPAEDFGARIGLIRDQVGELVIVDNDSSPRSLAVLSALSGSVNLCLIRNSENLGVAAALNRGITRAMESGYRWALLLDQDTVPDPEMLKGLASAYENYPSPETIAIVGSSYEKSDEEHPISSPASVNALGWMETPVAISAGSLLSLSAYCAIGPFRDDYFIDCVDTEYCLRARSKGLKIIVATTPLMTHCVGQPIHYYLPWRRITLSNHSRVRRYYMTRNQVDVAKAYLFKEPSYVLRSCWERLKSTVCVCLFEEDGAAKTWFAAIGLFDGIFGRFDRKLS